MPPFIDDPGESSHHNGGGPFGLSSWYDGSVADLESVKICPDNRKEGNRTLIKARAVSSLSTA